MDPAVEIEKLKHQSGAGLAGCAVMAVAALALLFVLMAAPVFIARSREERPATAVAQASRPAILVTLPVSPALPTNLPTNTAAPTWTPQATHTAVPSQTPLPTYTPPATWTPQATHTAVPSQTPLPTYTPPATWTPQATHTAAPAALSLLPPALAPALPAAGPDPVDLVEAAVLALAITVAIFALALLCLIVYVLLQRWRPSITPTPLIIEGEVVPAPAPTPPPYQPAFIRPLPPQERRYRPVAPVTPVQPVLEGGVTTLTGGGGVVEICVPFDKTRPPTPAEMAYIRARYIELGSVNKVAADCWNTKSPVILGYIRQALEQGGIAYPARRPQTQQRMVIIQ